MNVSSIKRELRKLLSEETFESFNLNNLPAFYAWLVEKLPDWSDQDRRARAGLIVFEAAMTPPDEVVISRTVRKPLVAAKHLLGLGAYNAEKLNEVVADTDKSLAFFKVEGAKVRQKNHPLDDLGLRQRIASAAAGYGYDRSNGTKRLDVFVDALWEQLQRTVQREDLWNGLEVRRREVKRLRDSYQRYNGSPQRRGEESKKPQWGKKYAGIIGAAAVGLAIVIALGVTLSVWGAHGGEPSALHTSADPDVKVCNSIDADRIGLIALDPSKDDLKIDRASTYKRWQEASRGSELASALMRNIAALDAMQAWTSGNRVAGVQVLDVFNGVMKAGDLVAVACGKLGVRFHGFNVQETADGSISHSDAVQYCKSVHAFLDEAAIASTNDVHLLDLMKIMIDRSEYGLPSKIYVATAELESMVVLAMANQGDPSAEQAMGSIRSYCTNLDPAAWSS